jgi:nucleoside-diphosphate-sugar epimerase
VKPARKILIAGCGYIGSALASRLIADGDEVWGLRRRPEGLPPGVHPLAFDLLDPDLLRRLDPDFDVVVYGAAPGGSTETAYRATYVHGVRNLIGAVTRTPRPDRQFLFISSTRVYGQSEGEWVDEDSPAVAAGFRASCLREGEALVRAAPLQGSVVRFGGIYGPGRRGSLERALAGLPVTRKGRPLYGNRIHRDDGAGILRHVLGLPKPEAMYLGVDSDPADRETVRAWLAERCGIVIPATESETGAGGDAERSNKRCSNRRVLASGYQFLYPTFREGFAALLEGGGPGK